MKTKYTAEYFINKFSKIPDEKWIINSFRKGDACCALGHCGVTTRIHETPASYGLRNLFYATQVLPNIVQTNDALIVSAAELGDTPKERILNALTLIAAGVTVD